MTFALVHGAWHDRSTWLRRVLAGCVAATALSLALGWSATGAQAAHVSCGDTITADTTLHKDLVNCPNSGIIIGADDITLDLNDHTIDGDVVDLDDDGGVVNLGHDGVTVTNGSVREFEAGVSVSDARNNRVLNISTHPIYFGVLFRDVSRTVVRGSSVSGALGNDAAGLLLLSSRHVRILHNSLRHSRKGIEMVVSNSNLIKGNVFSRNDDEGVLIRGSARNRVTRNRFVRNGDAITITPFAGNPTPRSSRNVITHNRVSRGRYGILIEKGRRNLVAHNVVAHTHRAGIRLGINPFRGGAHNVVRRNLVRGSREDGFVVAKSDRHSHLKRNISVGARRDGFDVEGRRSKLTRNDARRNGDLGIEAVRGVIDGGGNRASGNGDPRQCTHISCR